MSNHVPGEMDITEQERTFHGFIKAGVIMSVIVTVVLIFLAFVGT